MKKFTRDLLLLKKKNHPAGPSLQREINSLNALLHQVETSRTLHIAYELIDVNRYKVVHEEVYIMRALKPRGLKPFQFLVNRN
jgi:hypothetical protein